MASSSAAPNGSAPQKDIQGWASNDGAFRRLPSSFRNFIEKGGEFPPESGRYHLYISLACPWAHRTLIVRNLKGLQDAISLSVVHWNMGPLGWRFLAEGEVAEKVTTDPIFGAKHLREVYFAAEPEYAGRFTVPVLFDKKTKKIVNNESSEIIRMLNDQFDEWSSKPGLTFYPEALRDKIEAVNPWIYHQINNGVYRSGFATSQDQYELACFEVFEGLDKVEAILSKSEFLAADTFTEADVRLFTTIVRFQSVYHGHFKCNIRTIYDYPSILRWARRIYQMPGIGETVDQQHIKHHYYESHTKINPTSIVPLGMGPDFSMPVIKPGQI
ncbi:hypothetical protein DFJ74DRAFT_609072 [Hyaloraphidium curvatum]|nr:hypothetical protein DFJ74DRAFT_609072 [Hyaloraphidium curvatum]